MSKPEISCKKCSKCHETKPLDAFSKAVRGIGGRRAECRECDAKARAFRTARRVGETQYREMHEIPSVVTRWLEQHQRVSA